MSWHIFKSIHQSINQTTLPYETRPLLNLVFRFQIETNVFTEWAKTPSPFGYFLYVVVIIYFKISFNFFFFFFFFFTREWIFLLVNNDKWTSSFFQPNFRGALFSFSCIYLFICFYFSELDLVAILYCRHYTTIISLWWLLRKGKANLRSLLPNTTQITTDERRRNFFSFLFLFLLKCP